MIHICPLRAWYTPCKRAGLSLLPPLRSLLHLVPYPKLRSLPILISLGQAMLISFANITGVLLLIVCCLAFAVAAARTGQ